MPFTEEEYRRHVWEHQILVVDDEEQMLWEVAGVGMANGFYCSLVKSAPEAWEKLTKEPKRYELMVCDNSMLETPDSAHDYDSNEGLPLLGPDDWGNQGLQLLRRVRNEAALKMLDVIIYTGGGGKAQAEALGAIYVPKQPYLLNDILRERSGLYREAVRRPEETINKPEEAKKGFWDFLKR